MKFNITHWDTKSNARTGFFKTSHGVITTPVFMPVGTSAAVKGVHIHELQNDLNTKIMLCNTYHLYLRPSIEVINKAGGIHKFIHWENSILTDSGGYQVFSLANNCKINEQGATFQSHIDGSTHAFTPEKVIEIQRAIGADIIMAFDECTPYPCDYEYAKKSMLLTHRWLKRCITKFNETTPYYNYEQYLFPIVQGSVYSDLRKQSAEFIASQNLFGNAIGGLSVGEPENLMYEMLEIVNTILPVSKPRYLMGVGTPANILEAISLGVDMFDCVLPTRNARHGLLYTYDGIINIKNEKWKNDFSVIDPQGTSIVDKQYSKAYLRHLIVSEEMLGAQIATLHNLSFFKQLTTDAQNHIIDGTFTQWKNTIINKISTKL